MVALAFTVLPLAAMGYPLIYLVCGAALGGAAMILIISKMAAR